MLPILAVLSAQIWLSHLAPSTSATPLQLHQPTLFNSALSSPPTLAIINTTLPNANDCFEYRPDRFPINYVDCALAVLEMNARRDLRRYTFGRGSHATYKLPKTFESGTCSVNLDMVYDEQTDRLTLAEVEQAAFALASQCATGQILNLGGIVAVGPKKVLYITILGIRALPAKGTS